MNPQTDSALREMIETLLSESKSIQIFDGLVENAEAFARALVAYLPDLVIVPRELTAQMVAVIEDVNCKYETMPEFYSALLLAAQPTAQEK